MAPARKTTRVLIVDDEQLIRDSIAEFLAQEGFDVVTCGTAREGLKIADESSIDVALCDVQLPDIDGIELLGRLLKVSPQTFVLLITAYGTVESAVHAFRQGAHDYLMKPILLEEVLGKIRRMLNYRDLYQENQWLRRELNRAEESDAIVGDSIAVQDVFEVIRKVAPTRSTVLITGESGTGKELVARAIHRQSVNPSTPFVALNCAAIPNDLLENQLFGHRKGAFTGADRDQAGVFVHARSGTVFLDEIGEMPLPTQAKLLRAIEQKEVLPVGANEPVAVDARILAATNKNLRSEVEKGSFREDLYYRLNVVTIALPPLRDRREDIPDLVDHLLARHNKQLGKRITGVTHEAMQMLLCCDWKGNVRELDNALQRAVILGEGPLVTPADLPPDLSPGQDDPGSIDDLSEAVRRFEKRHIERVLRRTTDKKEAARLLGMGLSSLYRRISELEIQTP